MGKSLTLLRHIISAFAVAGTLTSIEPVAAQRMAVGLLTCDVSAGIGSVVGYKREVTCSLMPEGSDRREDYDGSITKIGLDVGMTGPGRMVWLVFTNTV